LSFAKSERKNRLLFFQNKANFSSLRTAKSASKNSQLISKSPLIYSQNCPPKPEPQARARQQIQYGGVCWTMSEPFLSKTPTLTDAKLLRNFAIGSRAKNFLPPPPLKFFARSPKKSHKNFWGRFLNSKKSLRITFPA